MYAEEKHQHEKTGIFAETDQGIAYKCWCKEWFKIEPHEETEQKKRGR